MGDHRAVAARYLQLTAEAVAGLRDARQLHPLIDGHARTFFATLPRLPGQSVRVENARVTTVASGSMMRASATFVVALPGGSTARIPMVLLMAQLAEKGWVITVPADELQQAAGREADPVRVELARLSHQLAPVVYAARPTAEIDTLLDPAPFPSAAELIVTTKPGADVNAVFRSVGLTALGAAIRQATKDAALLQHEGLTAWVGHAGQLHARLTDRTSTVRFDAALAAQWGAAAQRSRDIPFPKDVLLATVLNAVDVDAVDWLMSRGCSRSVACKAERQFRQAVETLEGEGPRLFAGLRSGGARPATPLVAMSTA